MAKGSWRFAFIAALLLAAAPVWAQDATATGGPSVQFGGPGDPAAFIDSTVNLATTGIVEDVAVEVDITHTFSGDMDLTLTHVTSATAALFYAGAGADNPDILARFVNIGPPQVVGPFNTGACWTTFGAFAAFDTLDWNGDWTLNVTDVFPASDAGTLNSWTLEVYLANQPGAISDLVCTVLPSNEIDVSWTNNGNPTYDDITVELVGVTTPVSAGGGASNFLITPAPADGVYTVSIVATIAGDPCATGTLTCDVNVSTLPAADVSAASTTTPSVEFGNVGLPDAVTDTITVAATGLIGDMYVDLDITHTFIGDMLIGLTHNGVTQFMHAINGGGGADNISLTFWDGGPDYNTVPFDTGVMAPFQSFDCAFRGMDYTGDWVLDIQDVFPGSDGGTLNNWGVNFVTDAGAVLNSDPIENLVCDVVIGAGTADVVVTWDEPNPAAYDNIVLNITPDPALQSPVTLASGIGTFTFVALPSDVQYNITVESTSAADPCAVGLLDCDANTFAGCPPGNIPALAATTDPTTITPGLGIACPGGAYSFWRTFDVPATGTATVEINCLELGIETCDIDQAATLRFWQNSAVNAVPNPGLMTVLSEQPITIPAVPNPAVVAFELPAPACVSGQIVVEIAVPNGFATFGNNFFIGANASPDVYGPDASGDPTSYLSSTFCQTPLPTSMANIPTAANPAGNPDSHWVMNLIVNDNGCATCTGPSSVALTSDCATGDMTASWQNNDVYTGGITVDLLDGNGATVSSVSLGGIAASTVFTGFGGDNYTINVTTNCAAGSGSGSASTLHAPFVAGVTNHIIWSPFDANTGGIDSSAALLAALTAAGENAVIIENINTYPCFGDLPLADAVLWGTMGTFPFNHSMTGAEGQILADRISAGGSVYLEGGDVWFFDAQTPFADWDGQDGDSVFVPAGPNDGDASFIGMNGSAFAGLDLSDLVGIVYTQDAPTFGEFTDRLSVTGASTLFPIDLAGSDAGIIWSDDGTGGSAVAYDTGIFYDTDPGFGKVIIQSWEFGGFGGLQSDLAGRYVEALTPAVTPMNNFRRGDVDNNGSVVALLDGLFLLNFGFNSGPTPPCLWQADVDGNGSVVALLDGLYLLNFGFNGGSPPPAPGTTCGTGSTGTLTCLVPSNCP